MDLPGLMFNHPGVPTTRIYWPYLLSGLVLSLMVYLFQREKGKGLSVNNFLRFCFPKSIYIHKSALLDYLYLFINPVIYGLLFLPFLLSTPLMTGWVLIKLTHYFGEPAFKISQGVGVSIFITILAALFADFSRFIGHYLNHRIPFLWNFHKVHHSAEVLTPITVYRAHPVELFTDGTLVALSTGLVFGVFNYFSQTPMSEIRILQLNAVVFLFNLAGSNLRHSHIWISYPAFISRIFISPAQHQIHHSLNPIHFNKNFGSEFAFWDWLFKSLYIPKKREKIEIGLARQEHKEFSSLFRFYFLPLKKNLGLILKRRRPAQTSTGIISKPI